MLGNSKTNRKPLILRGARQVGKTTLIKEFAKTYEYQLYINLEKKVDSQYFEQTDDVKVIIEALFISNNITTKDICNTLLFIDEIQEHYSRFRLINQLNESQIAVKYRYSNRCTNLGIYFL